MNEKRKYELIIATIFLIGAIFCGILDIFSLVIYLLIGILIFTLYILQKKDILVNLLIESKILRKKELTSFLLG